MKVFGKTRLENIEKIIGKEANELLLDHLKKGGSKELAIEYEDNSIIYLTIENNYVRYKLIEDD